MHIRLRQDVRNAVEQYLGDHKALFNVEGAVQDLVASYGLRDDYPFIAVRRAVERHRLTS